MKFILPTLLLATLATATPSSPFTGASIEQCNEALTARAAHAYNDAHSQLAARSSSSTKKKKSKKSKKAKKPKGGSGGSDNDTDTESAAMMNFVPSMGAIQVGVVGFGVLEVVRLWG